MMLEKQMNNLLKEVPCVWIYVLLLISSGYIWTDCKLEMPEASVAKIPKPSIFDKLSQETEIELHLTADWEALRLHKEDEKYVPALITYFNSIEELAVTEEIEIAARGKTRKNYCEVLPIRLKFPKSILKASKLAKYKTLKLVLPCMNGLEYSDLLKKELLCYKIFQTLTNNSFRVQPARVFLTSIDGLSDTLSAEAFLIENDKEMAKRIGGKRLAKSVSNISVIDVQSYNLLVLFQYMIGNVDWNLSRRHNVELVVTEAKSAPMAIPYDFDYSGLVNAPYARTHPDLPIVHVRERLFQWRGNKVEMLVEPISIFIENKSKIFDLLENCSLQDNDAKMDMIQYIREFYNIIESPDAVNLLTKK